MKFLTASGTEFFVDDEDTTIVIQNMPIRTINGNIMSSANRPIALLIAQAAGYPWKKVFMHDRDKTNLRRANLRPNPSGSNIVKLPDGRYQARFRHLGQYYNLGVFDSFEEADAAVLAFHQRPRK